MERKKLYNAYEQHEGYNCFGCASGNEHGLHCEFYEEGEYITCHWMPRPEFQGFFILRDVHAVEEERASICRVHIADRRWNVFAKVKSAGVTVELITKYRATVYSDRGELFLRSRIVEQTSRLAKMHVELFNADGTLGSEADVVYRIFPENVARQRLGWTGIEAFYPEETK